MIFYDFLWFFKYSAEINKKEKEKTTLQNRLRELFDWFGKFRG
jgi:hypothetical protein